MNEESRRAQIRWLEHVIWVLSTWTVLAIALALIAVESGLANPLLRRLLIQRVHALTGAPVEIRTVSVGWFSLDATVRGLVIHGTEPKDTEPLMSVEEVKVGLRIDSFWGRRVSLKELTLQEPRVHLRVEKNGANNLPSLRTTKSTKPLQRTLLDLHIGRVSVSNGWILYNNVKKLMAVEGGDLRLQLDYAARDENPLYVGTLAWDSIELARRRDVPIPANLSAKFSLGHEGLTIEQAIVDLGRSHLDLQAKMPDLETAALDYRYRAWLDLADLQEFFQTPQIPLGRIDLRGDGKLVNGSALGKGEFAGDNVTLGFQDFHSANLTTRSNYVLQEKGILLPNFTVTALGGTVKSRVTMEYEGLKFRAESNLENVRLSVITPAIEHEGFPIDELHWDSLISAQAVSTWREAFLDYEVSGELQMNEPEEVAEGHVPVTGDWKMRYRDVTNTLEVGDLNFETPTSRGTIVGVLAPKNSLLDVRLTIGSLENYSDFIRALSGDDSTVENTSAKYTGSLQWNGTIAGPSDGPTFQGHFRGENLKYSQIMLDSLDGDMTFSPEALMISHARARRGTMEGGVDGSMELTDWTFRPENLWSAEISLSKVPLEGLEQLGGWNYPLHGYLTGEFRGRGTRAEPALTGNFDLAEGDLYSVRFNRLRGQLNVLPDEVRLSNAELRFFEPGTETTGGAGIVTGNVSYRFADRFLTTDLVGASLPLENFRRIKAAGLPVGGQITFRLKSTGKLVEPVADGTFRLVDFRVGDKVIGSIDGELNADGKDVRLKLKSAMSTGSINGDVRLGFRYPMPVDGRISIQNISLDPYLASALHMKDFSGHGTADGDITVQGELQHPESVVVEGNFTRFLLTYQSVSLENSGPIHLTSTRDSLKIISATLKGADTNVDLSGSIQFTGRRTLAMRLNGAVDLRLISAYIPGVGVAGHVDVNASFENTLDRPRIIGKMKLLNASMRSADFPTGLSNVKGDLVFDANRLFFENMTGEAGGGVLTLSGSVNYSETPARYDISARTDRVRIRYPEGLSWLVGANLRLSGTLTGGLLSGKVLVQRVNLTQGLESASALVSSNDSGGTTSSYLRNLQFDVEAASTPDTRMEWPGAHLEIESGLRVRGTAEHPIMLGHIHVVSGDLYFRDNHYRVTRGDLNFANPFRLDPTINVEATTTIQQYEITLNFTGQSSKLALSYRSDPPLPGNDIVTLLALGQTTSESALRTGGLTQTGTSGASALLSEAISSQLGGRVERLFGITRFRVDPGLAGVGSTGSNQNAAARITVEQQVTRNLSIMYVSNVSSTQQQVIQVEYNVNRNVSVVALRDQNGTFGIDIKIKKRLP